MDQKNLTYQIKSTILGFQLDIYNIINNYDIYIYGDILVKYSVSIAHKKAVCIINELGWWCAIHYV